MTSSPPAAPPADPWDDAGRRRQQRAWYVYDWANSAYFTTIATVLFGPYLTVVAKRAACPGQDTDLDCGTDLHILGVPISTGSLAFYTVAVSTILSALVLPVVGALADRTGRKRSLMAGLAWAGAVAASGLFLVAGDDWQLGVVLLVISALCAGASLVVYDAILCDIAEPAERDGVSSRGWAAGYLGGGLLLALNLVLITFHDAVGLSTELAVRVSMLSAGLWWGLFTIIPFRVLRDLPPAQDDVPLAGLPGGGRAGGLRLVGESFGQLRRTLAHLRGYPQTVRFLVAYLFFNDGIQTVIYAASIFGQEYLKLSSQQLVLTILVVQFVAFGGALLFGQVARRAGAQRTILSSLVLWCVVVSIGYALPVGRFLPFVALALLIGLVLGGSQAISRSLFSLLIPPGKEAEYFSLYQSAERGTSWLGTLLFGLTYQLTGSYRNAIIALVVFFIVGGGLLSRVDVQRGIEDAAATRPAVA